MDILAHALWCGAGLKVIGRKVPISRRVQGIALAASIAPDLVHLLPFIGLLDSGAGIKLLWDYIVQPPNQQPVLPEWLAAWSHHLHCIFHSALVFSAVAALVWLASLRLWPGLWPHAWPMLAAWLSHVVIDIFTHSSEFYPVAFLYPVSTISLNGVAWNTGWFMALNYSALAAVWLWIFTRRAAA